MHKKPLTELEERGLRNHRLPIGTPSQVSDAFRHGIAWALAAENARAEAWKRVFWDVALALNCLPSTFVDGNAHVLRKAQKLGTAEVGGGND